MTLEEYLCNWLANHSPEVKPRTRSDFEHLIRVYVAPRLGRMRLHALRPADLSALYRELLESGGKAGGRWRPGRWSTCTGPPSPTGAEPSAAAKFRPAPGGRGRLPRHALEAPRR
ncbi:MAG: hypothetical protein GXY39_10875 [Actinomycetales bacterium]|nr:hypothetical protein [Actinomycetales bacterium]HHU10035.1 hypothetical protein [Intrasporangiaceae bacterium]